MLPVKWYNVSKWSSWISGKYIANSRAAEKKLIITEMHKKRGNSESYKIFAKTKVEKVEEKNKAKNKTVVEAQAT